MTLFFDENLPVAFVRSLEQLHILALNARIGEDFKFVHVPDQFGVGCLDEDWIPQLKLIEGAFVITKDVNMKRKKHQYQLLREAGVGVFFLSVPSEYNFFALYKLLVKHWEAIVKSCQNDHRPFAYKITSRCERLELLD